MRFEKEQMNNNETTPVPMEDVGRLGAAKVNEYRHCQLVFAHAIRIFESC
jgi:hypothetical protein